MLKVTVKTLDSQNHSFNVPDESTVKEFKEQIAPVLNITVDKQRLIFCGKVLKDDKKLTEYDVDGKVIHVVQSLPPQGNTNSASSSSNGTTTNGGSRGGRDAAGFLLGAFSIPQDLVDPTQVQNIVHDVVSGMGEIGRNATVMSRASDDGTVDVHINLGRVPVSVPMQSEAQLRMNRVQTMLIRANHLLDTLEDGPNSNNGNVADSSSQTESGNTESENSSVESEPGNSNSTNEPQISMFDNIDTTNLPNTEITSEINLDVPNDLGINPERFRFEGLAHAAQAAISAAFATAAAAARAAATSVGTPVIGSVNSLPLDLRTVSSEPMEDSSSEAPIPDFMDANIGPEDTIVVDTIPPESADNEPSSTTQSEIKTEPSNSNAQSNSQAAEPSTQTLPSASSSTTGASNAPGISSTARRARRQVQPSVQTLANLLDEVIRFNTRLQPSLERVRDLIRNDSPLSGRPCADAQRLFSRISQMLHFLSHAFHSLSDLHVNFTHAPPRSPRVRIISSAQGSILQGLPMQAQISISTSSGPSSSSVSSTTTTANNSTTTNNTQNANAEVRPSPQTGTQASASTIDPPPTSGTRTQNPLVFMEVSPTVTIDSITSIMNPLLNNPNSLFNLLQVPEGSNTSTSDTSTPTTETPAMATPTSQTDSSTDSSRNAAPRASVPNAVPPLNGQSPNPLSIPFRNLIPVPLSSMGSLHTFDPGLPCHSVWALEPSRRRHNAGGSRTPAAHQQPGVTPNIPGRQEDQLQQVISNIVMSLLNHGHTPAQGNSTPNVTVFSSRSGDLPRESSIFTTASGQTNRDRVSRPERSSSSPNRVHARSSSAGALTGDQSVRSMLSNLGLFQKKIAEVFINIDPQQLEVLGGFAWFLANNLAFQDIVDFGVCNFEAITRLQAPLQKYLLEKVFKTENPTTQDYMRILSKVLLENDDEMLRFVRLAGVQHNEVRNYLGDFHTLLRENIHILFDALLGRSSPPPNTTYGQHVVRCCRELFEKFLKLNSKYSNLDIFGLERVFRRQLEPITDRVDPVYQSSVRVLILSSLYRLTNGVTRNFFYPENAQSAASSSTGGNNSNVEKKPESNPRPQNREFSFSQLVDEEGDFLTSTVIPRGSFTERSEDGAAPTLAAIARIAEQTSAIFRGTTGRTNDTRSPAVNVTEVVIRPESWHSSIPQDWVPIITRDVQRQRRQAPQAPFSNAYLSGMPSKRRKIMTNDAPTILEHSQNALSDMLSQAISSADVKPLTSIEELKSDVSQDNVLQSSFNEHMKHAIQERLQRDLDYCSEKFPNSEKYYNI